MSSYATGSNSALLVRDSEGNLCLRQYICNPEDIVIDTDNTDQAGETISAVKAVYLDSAELFLGQPNSLPTSQIVGVSLTAGNTGSQIKYRSFGELYDSSFNFTVGNCVFLDNNGNITETDPQTLGLDYRVVIGKVIADNGIFINIEEPIQLS